MDLIVHVACLDSTSDLLQELPAHVLECLITSDDFLGLLMLYKQPVYVHILTRFLFFVAHIL